MPKNKDWRIGTRGASWLIEDIRFDNDFIKSCIKRGHKPDLKLLEKYSDRLSLELSLAAFIIDSLHTGNTKAIGLETATERIRAVNRLKTSASQYAKNFNQPSEKNPIKRVKYHKKLQNEIAVMQRNVVLRLDFQSISSKMGIYDSDGLSGLFAWQTDYEHSLIEDWADGVNALDKPIITRIDDPDLVYSWRSPMPPSHALKLVEVCEQVLDLRASAVGVHYFSNLIRAVMDYWSAYTGRGSNDVRAERPENLIPSKGQNDSYGPNNREYSYVYEYLCTLLAQADGAVTSDEAKRHWPSIDQVISVQKEKRQKL